MEFAQRALVPDIGHLNFELDTMDTFEDIDIKQDLSVQDPLAEFSMEHSLNLFEFDSMKDLSLDIEAIKVGEKRSFLDELDTKDKIRRDCMWSTGQNLCKLFKADIKPESKHCRTKSHTSLLSMEEMSLTPPTSYINQYLKNFETPLPSDEESCCSSGDELSDWSTAIMDQENRLGGTEPILTNTSSKDHCYSSPRISCNLTPPESSEDEDSSQGLPVGRPIGRTRVLDTIENDRLNQAVKSILLATNNRTVPHTNKAKFTFKVNIKTNSKTMDKTQYLRSASVFRRSASSRLLDRPKDARDLHNHMERQRRTELKNAFDLVKTCVPTISASDRASKQMILDKAIEFCRGLRRKENSASKLKRTLQENNRILQKKLQILKKQNFAN